MVAQNKNPFRQWIRLEQPRLGTKVVYATDDFFADKSRLIDPAEPVFIADKFDDNGKWMDGWESRRKRVKGHDYCVIHLGVRGIIRGLDIDTRHFTGNFPPEASVEACVSLEENPGDAAGWQEIQPRVTLHGDAHHYLAVEVEQSFTHLRLHIYPDGGVARLRTRLLGRFILPMVTPIAEKMRSISSWVILGKTVVFDGFSAPLLVKIGISRIELHYAQSNRA